MRFRESRLSSDAWFLMRWSGSRTFVPFVLWDWVGKMEEKMSWIGGFDGGMLGLPWGFAGSWEGLMIDC